MRKRESKPSEASADASSVASWLSSRCASTETVTGVPGVGVAEGSMARSSASNALLQNDLGEVVARIGPAMVPVVRPPGKPSPAPGRLNPAAPAASTRAPPPLRTESEAENQGASQGRITPPLARLTRRPARTSMRALAPELWRVWVPIADESRT